MQTRIYGIDLGTTYSCISYVDEHGKPVTIPNFEGDLTTPSVVYFESPDNIVVGKHAKNASKLDPERTVAFVKRSMGDPTFAFSVDGKAYSPEEISSLILRKVVNDAALSLGEPITDVVITCPAYFGINQREATKNAGVLAGLNVHHILNEPTAAAICYGMNRLDENKTVLVYDLGGGTFDVTVIAIQDGGIQVVVTGGDHNLGGKDWDDRLINYFAEQFLEKHPDAGDPRDDAQSLQDLVVGAEDAKKGLTSKERWPFMVSHNGRRERVEITREIFEDLTRDLLDRTVELTRTLLADAKQAGHGAIDQLLLVGGSSKMPYVAAALKAAFGLEGQLFDPDQSVAKGAAYMGLKLMAGEALREQIAAQTGTAKDEVDLAAVSTSVVEAAAEKVAEQAGPALRFSSKEIATLATSRVVNVCSKGFGVVVTNNLETMAEEVFYLIQANTPVPAEIVNRDFGTLHEDQGAVHIRVMEQAGQTPDPAIDNNRDIVDGELTGLPARLPAGSPIHVTFRLVEDGTLAVMAVEPVSGRELKLDAKVDGVMSQQEVQDKKRSLMKLTVS